MTRKNVQEKDPLKVRELGSLMLFGLPVARFEMPMMMMMMMMMRMMMFSMLD